MQADVLRVNVMSILGGEDDDALVPKGVAQKAADLDVPTSDQAKASVKDVLDLVSKLPM